MKEENKTRFKLCSGEKVITSTHPIDIIIEDPLNTKKLKELLVDNRDAINAYISKNNQR